MHHKNVKVSVVMAAYNAERYISQSIDSILNQTFENFEFIIVNDGSEDSTLNIIKSYQDPRIIVFNQDNQGCAKARHRAIKYARGEYIAIMDADDISLPYRLEISVRFLDTNPSVVLVGTGFIAKDETTNIEEERFHPRDHEDILRFMLFDSPFLDPSVLIRGESYHRVSGYNLKYSHKFDYELLSRLNKIGKFANIQEILVITRRHSDQFYREGYSPEEHRILRLKIRWLTLWRSKPHFLLFVKTLSWLFFEFLTHSISVSIRHKLPSSFRLIFKSFFNPEFGKNRYTTK